jgi:PKD repeat protein
MRQRVWKQCAVTTGVVAAAIAMGGCVDAANDVSPQFTVSPSPAQTDQTVTFDARTPPLDPPTAIKKAWDLDGDGRFETPGGLVVTNAYPSPGVYEIGLDYGSPVSGLVGGVIALQFGVSLFVHDYTTRELVVTAPVPHSEPGQPKPNQPPVAVFAHDADPGHTDAPVRFDAKESSDPDGHVASYVWEFGDVRAQTHSLTTTESAASYHYDYPGNYLVRLRVVDDGGSESETTRMVQVVDGAPPSALSSNSALRAAATTGSAFTTTMEPTVMLDEGLLTHANGAMVRGGVVARGRFTLGRRLAAPLNGTRTPRWTAGFMVKQRGHGSATMLAVEGQLLMDFGRGDRVCFSARVAGRRGSRDSGRLTVIGGTGAAARLSGSGTFGVGVGSKGLEVKGRLLLEPGDHSRALPRECRTLLRASRRRS